MIRDNYFWQKALLDLQSLNWRKKSLILWWVQLATLSHNSTPRVYGWRGFEALALALSP
jgi:hypothetical protein